MDLGALELQIFVSLVVVLGSAFVALICDYLKGNNEQLRERNIELRVRTEERERFAILNPSAWLAQFRSSSPVAAQPVAMSPEPVAAEAVMQSHAAAEGLAQVAEREAALVNRAAVGEDRLAEAPPVAGFDVSERRRSRRKRGLDGEKANKPGENSYDWVRPEVMARVARRAGSASQDVEEDVREVVAAEAPVAEFVPAEPVPVAAAEVEKPLTPTLNELPVMAETVALQRPAEVEHVAHAQARPASTPPVIMLRPLPAMKLADELQRIAESAQASPAPYSSQLLEDVIAASAAKTPAPLPVAVEAVAVEPVAVEPVAVEPVAVEAVAVEPVEVEAVEVEAVVAAEVPAVAMVPAVVEAEAPQPEQIEADAPSEWSEAAYVGAPESSGELLALPVLESAQPVFAAFEDAVEPVAMPVLEAPAPEFPIMAAEPTIAEREPAYAFDVPQYAGSALAEALDAAPALVPDPPPFVEELPFPSLAAVSSPETTPVVEEPVFAVGDFSTYDSLPPAIETPAYDWSGSEFAPLPETVFASEAFAAETYPELTELEPVADVAPAALPVIEPAYFEEPAVAQAPTYAELLLPTGMQDLATYWRLLEMPNPMSGIVITISINDLTRLSASVGEQDLKSLLDSVEVLMTSMVRDGDFGVKVSADQWVFVYRIDDSGLSQRRVAGLSEKLWDFQLRHLGLSNISFSWAAVNVHAERLSDAVAAAQERMETSRRGTKKSGAERARLVVNG
jgi:hypothetical protein